MFFQSFAILTQIDLPMNEFIKIRKKVWNHNDIKETVLIWFKIL